MILINALILVLGIIVPCLSRGFYKFEDELIWKNYRDQADCVPQTDNDPCCPCYTHDTGNVCHRIRCPPLPWNCEEKRLDNCGCEVCACRFEGKYLTDGDTWRWVSADDMQVCEECTCINNKANCTMPGECPTCTDYIERQPGKCCRTCAPKPTFIISPTTENSLPLPIPDWLLDD